MVKAKGLSFFELLITLALLLMVLFFSSPVGHSFYRKNQCQSLENEIKTVLYFARTLALAKNKNLILSPMSSADWSQGAMLYIDEGTHRLNPNEKLLYQWQWKTAGIQVTWHGFQSREYLLFTPDIRRNALNGYFLISTPLEQRKIIVNRLGRARL